MPAPTSLLDIHTDTAAGRDVLSRMKPSDFDQLQQTWGYRAYRTALNPVVLTASLAAWGLVQFVLLFSFPETDPRNVWWPGGAVLVTAILLWLFVMATMEDAVEGLKPLHESPARVADLLAQVEAHASAREYRDKVLAEGGRELLEFDARALDALVQEAVAGRARAEQSVNWNRLHLRSDVPVADTSNKG